MQTRIRTQLGQLSTRVAGISWVPMYKPIEDVFGRSPAARSGRGNEYLGPSEDTDRLGFAGQAAQQPSCPFVVGVAACEVSYQHTGIQYDHAGHSWRSLSRSPG